MPEMDGIDTMRAIRKLPQLQEPADHRGDRQGDEGRPREVHRGRRLGLPVQAGRHRAAAGRAARLAVPLSDADCRSDAGDAGRRDGRHPGRRRPAGEAAGLRDGARGARARTSSASRSGAEALREVLQREFAVILLDVNMPEHGRLRDGDADPPAQAQSAHTPIIFLTAYADEMQTARGYSLGAVDYILTPVVPEMLRSKVRVFVDLLPDAAAHARQADERVALARGRGGARGGRGERRGARPSSPTRAASSAARSTSTSAMRAAARAAGAAASPPARRCCWSTPSGGRRRGLEPDAAAGGETDAIGAAPREPPTAADERGAGDARRAPRRPAARRRRSRWSRPLPLVGAARVRRAGVARPPTAAARTLAMLARAGDARRDRARERARSTAACSARSCERRARRGAAAGRRTGARTSSSRCCRTSCATRWRRSATRSR